MGHTARRLHTAAVFASLIAAAFAGGCASGQSTPTMVEVVKDYREGRYSEAYEQAVQLTGPGNDRISSEASYMAGMSAYRLGKEDEALRHLGKLTDHQDDALAGPAGATVGLIMAKRGQHDRALHYYTLAVPRLKGTDQAQAYYHMAVTEQKLGRWAQARPHLILAATNTTDPELRAAAEHRMKTAGFTLQFGAYTLQRNAEQRAREASRLTERAGLGAARIVTSEAAGRKLYHVQAGQFGTHESALAAMRKLNRTDVSVEQLAAQK